MLQIIPILSAITSAIGLFKPDLLPNGTAEIVTQTAAFVGTASMAAATRVPTWLVNTGAVAKGVAAFVDTIAFNWGRAANLNSTQGGYDEFSN